MIEAFRQRGIYADGVVSLAEESLLWNNVERQLPSLSQEALPLMREVFFNAVRAFDGGWTGGTDASPSNPAGQSVTMDEGEEIDLDVNEEFAKQLKLYAEKNADGLSLSRSFPIQVRGFHTVFRVAPNGRLLVELVAQFAQADHSSRGTWRNTLSRGLHAGGVVGRPGPVPRSPSRCTSPKGQRPGRRPGKRAFASNRTICSCVTCGARSPRTRQRRRGGTACSV